MHKDLDLGASTVLGRVEGGAPARAIGVAGVPAAPAAPAPVLLTDGSWYGTLAAARDLGERGVPVVLATDVALAPARFSRHVLRTVRCPPTWDAERFLDWLHDFGERNPGHAYCPTSDDTGWLAATHREILAPHFRLGVPRASALAPLLDKGRLAERARAAGLDVPDTFCPADAGEVERLLPDLPFPLLLKPRTQVLARSGLKGRRVDRREDLLPAWHAFERGGGGPAPARLRLPGADLPLLQRRHDASERIYTVDGFVDPLGRATPMLACRKLLQHPRRSGPGVAFEAAPLDARIEAGLARLLRGVGFHGPFDAEFVEDGDRLLLIDLNPRFYNHMAFEADRGLPLAWLSYLAACGEDRRLGEALAAFTAGRSGAERAYAHRLVLAPLLLGQRLSGAMGREERRRWRDWLDRHAGELTDPTARSGDRWPAVWDALFQLHRLVRHPRTSLRGLLGSGS